MSIFTSESYFTVRVGCQGDSIACIIHLQVELRRRKREGWSYTGIVSVSHSGHITRQAVLKCNCFYGNIATSTDADTVLIIVSCTTWSRRRIIGSVIDGCPVSLSAQMHVESCIKDKCCWVESRSCRTVHRIGSRSNCTGHLILDSNSLHRSSLCDGNAASIFRAAWSWGITISGIIDSSTIRSAAEFYVLCFIVFTFCYREHRSCRRHLLKLDIAQSHITTWFVCVNPFDISDIYIQTGKLFSFSFTENRSIAL